MPETINIEVSMIRANPFQPKSRIKVSNAVIEQFASSILEHGLIQFPVVRKMPDNFYEMGDGWIRLCAYKSLIAQDGKYQYLPCIVKALDDRQMADLVMEANTVRKDLNPIELAEFYAKYLMSFNIKQEELAQLHHCSQGEISNTIRLLDLPEVIQEMIISQKISPAHGRSLLQMKDKTMMVEFARRCADNGWAVAFLDSCIKSYRDSQKPKFIKEEKKPESLKQEPPTVDEKTKSAENPSTPALVQAQNRVDEKPEEKQELVHSEETPAVADATQTLEQAASRNPAASFAPTAEELVDAAHNKTAATATIEKPESQKVEVPPRKLSLQEVSDGVLFSGMKLGGSPVIKKLKGRIEDVLPQLAEILKEVK